MKTLITTVAFLLLGTVSVMAQTTQTKENKIIMPEKPAGETEMKLQTPIQPNGMNRTVDTADIAKRQKAEDNRLQRQAVPQKDGLNNEAVKPAQPAPEQME